MNPEEQRKQFIEPAHAKIPFGKYKDRLLVDLPEYYLVWFKNKGFSVWFNNYPSVCQKVQPTKKPS